MEGKASELNVTADEVKFLVADVLALTGASSSYLTFLIKQGVVQPQKARNARTNLFSSAELERVRWALENRGRLSIEEMRRAVDLSAAPSPPAAARLPVSALAAS